MKYKKKFEILFNYQKVLKGSRVDESLRQNTILMVILNDIKSKLLQRDTLKNEELIIKRPFHRFKKDSLRIILALIAHYDLKLHQMDV